MEAIVSAVTGDLVSRFITHLINKFSGYSSMEKVETLQLLLCRVKIVVDESDGRYITNRGMLIQLKMLAEIMYQGYHALDIFKYKQLQDERGPQVGESLSLFFPRTLKCCRTTAAITSKFKFASYELQTALDNLETAVANMAEYVILLGGCERMLHRPYDSCFYIDNFMFGRHVENQQLINILLENNTLISEPTVIPIVGGRFVGKRTLVAHICNDEKVRNTFSSIMHLDGDNFLQIEGKKFKFDKTLVIVSFGCNIRDDEWTKFYSSVTCMGRGSKVILISRLEILGRFGTVKPIRVNSLSDHEFSYLFKTLAFGSANPQEQPQLASTVEAFVPILGGSLTAAHIVADLLRKNINLRSWLYILETGRSMAERNFDVFGEHTNVRLARGDPVEMVYSAAAAPLQVSFNVPSIELPTVTVGELFADPTVCPKGDFNLLSLESRIPPYTKFVVHVPARPEDNPETFLQGNKKRRR